MKFFGYPGEIFEFLGVSLYLIIPRVMVLAYVMMIPHVMVLAHVMMLPYVMVLAHVMVLPCVMVLAYVIADYPAMSFSIAC